MNFPGAVSSAAVPDQLLRRLERELAKEKALAQQHLSRAELIEATIENIRRLPKSEQDVSLRRMFTDPLAHRLKTSEGRSTDALLVASRKADPPYTLRTLAEKVGMSPAALSMARKGTKPIRRAKAEAIKKLTGFEVSLANWPGGIID